MTTNCPQNTPRTLYIKSCDVIKLFYISTKSSQEISDTGVSTKSEYLSRLGELHQSVGRGNGDFFISVEEAKSICEIWGFTPVEDCHPSKFLQRSHI